MLRCRTTQLREDFLKISTNSRRFPVDSKLERAMQSHRRGVTKIDPNTTAMCFQMITAQQAAAPGSEVIGGKEAAGMSKAMVSSANVNVVGG